MQPFKSSRLAIPSIPQRINVVIASISLMFGFTCGVIFLSLRAQSNEIRFKQRAFLAAHPSSTCNYIAERTYVEPVRAVEYVFVRGCGGRDPRTWEQQLLDVRSLSLNNVIFVPAQEMVDGRVLGGNYFCLYSSLPPSSSSATCTATGWVLTWVHNNSILRAVNQLHFK